MRLIDPSFEIWEQGNDIDSIYRHAERCGKVCYKSEHTITDSSYGPFIQRLIDSKHYSVLEHATIYLTYPLQWTSNDYDFEQRYKHNPYSRMVQKNGEDLVTTNLRVILENEWQDDLQYMTSPTQHEKRHTVHFTCNIHFYKDCTRHRRMSWSIESTRYCNYFKERFGGSIAFIMPLWATEEEKPEIEKDFETIEAIYMKWIEKGWQPQQAATFLPQATKAEAIMTGFESDFKHFFNLRALGTTGAPHPQVKELVYPLMEEFIKLGYYVRET